MKAFEKRVFPGCIIDSDNTFYKLCHHLNRIYRAPKNNTKNDQMCLATNNVKNVHAAVDCGNMSCKECKKIAAHYWRAALEHIREEAILLLDGSEDEVVLLDVIDKELTDDSPDDS